MAVVSSAPQSIHRTMRERVSLWKQSHTFFHLNPISKSSRGSNTSGQFIPGNPASLDTSQYQDPRSLNCGKTTVIIPGKLKNTVMKVPVLVDACKSVTVVVDAIAGNYATTDSSALISRDLPVIDSSSLAESIAIARREFIDASREAGKRQRDELANSNIAAKSDINITAPFCLDGPHTVNDVELMEFQAAYNEYCRTYCRKPGLFGIKRFLKSMQDMTYYPLSASGSKAFDFVGKLIGGELNEESYANYAVDETELATHAARVLRRAMSQPQDNTPPQADASTGISVRIETIASAMPNTIKNVRSKGTRRSADVDALQTSDEPSILDSAMRIPVCDSLRTQSNGNATYLRRNMHPRSATCLYCEREEVPVRRKQINIELLLDRVEEVLASNETYAQHRGYSTFKPFWSLMSDRILSEMQKQIGHLYGEGYILAESIEDIGDCSKALYWAYEKRLKVEQALEGGHTIKARLYRWLR
ncbi:hypothetical protein V1508DRAFT_276480 [Lipomyces doorenjongii]|uniref:uncharacterized protein n=1 Tax=Lipomyces doorenjongii TaxID=383834 RepID=UPI0034CF91F3